MATPVQIGEDDWLAERRTGIGGSDVHHVMNERPYGCARYLYYDKTGAEPDYNNENEGLFKRGHKLEPIIAAEYEEATGKKVRRMQTRVNTDRPWERVNCDRQIVGDPRGPGVLECKSMGAHAFSPVKRDGLPAAHVLQLQWALMVTGYKWGAFAVLEPASWELLTFEMERNEPLIASIGHEAAVFWARIRAKRIPPQLENEDDTRCQSCVYRKTCRGSVATMQIAEPEITHPVEQDDTLAEIVQDYWAAKEAVAQADAVYDMVAAALKDRIGERQAIEVPSLMARISYKQQKDSLTWDGKFLDRHHPELKATCSKVKKGGRALTVNAPGRD